MQFLHTNYVYRSKQNIQTPNFFLCMLYVPINMYRLIQTQVCYWILKKKTLENNSYVFSFLQLWGCPGWIHTWMCFQRKSWGAILVSLRGYHCQISNCIECIWQFYHLFGHRVNVSSDFFQADCFSGKEIPSKELIIMVWLPRQLSGWSKY